MSPVPDIGCPVYPYQSPVLPYAGAGGGATQGANEDDRVELAHFYRRGARGKLALRNTTIPTEPPLNQYTSLHARTRGDLYHVPARGLVRARSIYDGPNYVVGPKAGQPVFQNLAGNGPALRVGLCWSDAKELERGTVTTSTASLVTATPTDATRYFNRYKVGAWNDYTMTFLTGAATGVSATVGTFTGHPTATNRSATFTLSPALAVAPAAGDLFSLRRSAGPVLDATPVPPDITRRMRGGNKVRARLPYRTMRRMTSGNSNERPFDEYGGRLLYPTKDERPAMMWKFLKVVFEDYYSIHGPILVGRSLWSPLTATDRCRAGYDAAALPKAFFDPVFGMDIYTELYDWEFPEEPSWNNLFFEYRYGISGNPGATDYRRSCAVKVGYNPNLGVTFWLNEIQIIIDGGLIGGGIAAMNSFKLPTSFPPTEENARFAVTMVPHLILCWIATDSAGRVYGDWHNHPEVYPDDGIWQPHIFYVAWGAGGYEFGLSDQVSVNPNPTASGEERWTMNEWDYNDPETYVAEQRLYESPNTAIQLSPVRWEPPQLEFQHHFPMYGLKLHYE